MLKMAELAELKQEGLNFVSRYFEVMNDFFKILFKIQCCLKLLNIHMSNFQYFGL